MKKIFSSMIVICFLLQGVTWAAEQADRCPGPPLSIPRGLYVDANIGPAFWLGEVGKYSKPGIGLSFGLAYEWLSYVATELSYNVGMHETDQQSPPSPGSFSTHGFYGSVRLNLPLERIDIFGRGGLGIQWSTPDILVRVEGFDKDAHLSWLAGLGFVWHTPRKRFWLGIETRALGAVDFPGIMLESSVVLGCNI